jgi:hypothetical protein
MPKNRRIAASTEAYPLVTEMMRLTDSAIAQSVSAVRERRLVKFE